MGDVTRFELLKAGYSHLPPGSADDESRDLAVECAAYWYASDYHSGQWSDLYAALCASLYSPGLIETGPEPGTMEADVYAWMEHQFN